LDKSETKSIDVLLTNDLGMKSENLKFRFRNRKPESYLVAFAFAVVVVAYQLLMVLETKL
jgi:hypothetical protein